MKYLINFMILDTWLVLNSLSLIADGLYTLDNRRPVLPFDYVGRGFAGDDYKETMTRTVTALPVEDQAVVPYVVQM